MQQALYRRFRPKTFDEVIGQDHIVRALKNQINGGKIGHAYLFCGTRGTGKTSCAKIFAKAVNCLSPIDGSPCGHCSACEALSDPSNVDILEIDAASNNGVDEIRALRERIKYPPINVRYKVYIIDEVHMLTDNAFNALLKTLEEPPSHAVFILATTEPYKLPATILSRCARYDFRLVSKELLQDRLRKIFDEIGMKYDEASIEMIALAGEGSVRDCLSVADCVASFSEEGITIDNTLEILGTSDRDSVISLTDKIFSHDLGGVLEEIDTFVSSGKNMINFGKEMSSHFKDLLLIKTSKNYEKILSLPKDALTKMCEQAEKISSEELIDFMQKFSGIETELRYSLSPRTLIELVSLECASSGNAKKN